MKNIFSVIFFLSFLCVSVLSHEPVDLTKVDVLYFKKDSYALSTRGPGPVPQLICEYNPTGNDNYLPSSVFCENKGLDDKGGIIWKCEGDMPSTLLFDKLVVSCEGFSGPGDRLIRRGSCALKYTLRLSPEGERNLRNQQRTSRDFSRNDNPYSANYRNRNDRPEYYGSQIMNEVPSMKIDFWTVLIFVLAFFALLKCCLKLFVDDRRNYPAGPNYAQGGYNNGNYPNNQGNFNGFPPGNQNNGNYPNCAQAPGAGYGVQMGPPPRRFGWFNWGIPLGSFFLGRWSANRPLHRRTYEAPPVYQQHVYQQPVYQQPVYQQPAYQQPLRQDDGESRTERRTGIAETEVR